MQVNRADFNTGEVSFIKNEKWWADEGKLDKITYRYLEDQASLNAFQAGELDATRVAAKGRFATASNMGGKADIRSVLRPFNYLATLNGKSPQLEDVAVREAIMTGIDREQLAKIRFNGLNYSGNLPGSFVLFQTQDGHEDNFGARGHL